MADLTEKNTADSFKGFKDDLDAMLDEANGADYSNALLDDDDAAIERLLMGPDYEDKSAYTHPLDEVDALLNASAQASEVEVSKAAPKSQEQHIDALLDQAHIQAQANTPEPMDDYFDLFSDPDPSFLSSGLELETDVLEHALQDKLTADTDAQAASDAQDDALSNVLLEDLNTDALILDAGFDADALDILLDHQAVAVPQSIPIAATSSKDDVLDDVDELLAQASLGEQNELDVVQLSDLEDASAADSSEDSSATQEFDMAADTSEQAHTPLELASDPADVEQEPAISQLVDEMLSEALADLHRETLAGEDSQDEPAEFASTDTLDVDAEMKAPEVSDPEPVEAENPIFDDLAQMLDFNLDADDAFAVQTPAAAATDSDDFELEVELEPVSELESESLDIADTEQDNAELAAPAVAEIPEVIEAADITDPDAFTDAETSTELNEITPETLQAEVESAKTPTVNDSQEQSVAEIDPSPASEARSEADFLMADFDISGEDLAELSLDSLELAIEPTIEPTKLDVEVETAAEQNDLIAELDSQEEVLSADLDLSAAEGDFDTELQAALAEPAAFTEHVPETLSAEPIPEPASYISAEHTPLEQEAAAQISALWAAHDLLRQQFSASATQPAANEFLADELEMLAKEQKVLRRNIDNQNKKSPAMLYTALGLGIAAALLGVGVLTMSLMGRGELSELQEQNATLQTELEALKHNTTSVNPEEINAALSQLTVKIDALEKNALQHNYAAQLEELQNTVNELKTGLANKAAVPNPANDALAVKTMVPKAEVVKSDAPMVIPPPPPPAPVAAPVKLEAATKPALKPSKVTPPKQERPPRVVAEVVKPKPKVVAENEPAAQVPPAGRWVANLVSFRQDWYAQGKAAEFARQGIYVQVVPVQVKGETWYRLRSNNFASKNDAQNFAAKAKRQLNLTSVWVADE